MVLVYRLETGRYFLTVYFPHKHNAVVLLGEHEVGKTSLVTRFTQSKFSFMPNVALGVNFDTRTIKVDGMTMKTQIWDEAGGCGCG